MRMKRKKNLDERIANSSDYLITMKNDSLNYNDAVNENHIIDFEKIFKKISRFILRSAVERVSSAVHLQDKTLTKIFFA